MRHLREFDGKTLTAADSADVKLSEAPAPEGEALPEAEAKDLATWLKETLGNRVAEVKASDRLTDSPAAVLNADRFMSPQMRRMMRAMSKDKDEETPLQVNLEFNPRHAIIKRLAATRASDTTKAQLVAEQLFDNALLAAGLLEDPSRMIGRLYKLLEQV